MVGDKIGPSSVWFGNRLDREAVWFLASIRHAKLWRRRRKPTPQLWQDFTLEPCVAAVTFYLTKQQPSVVWRVACEVWRTVAGNQTPSEASPKKIFLSPKMFSPGVRQRLMYEFSIVNIVLLYWPLPSSLPPSVWPRAVGREQRDRCGAIGGGDRQSETVGGVHVTTLVFGGPVSSLSHGQGQGWSLGWEAAWVRASVAAD
jgi:hypothetical protein